TKGHHEDAFSGFVTSRPFALSDNATEMATKLWFNVWQLRLWPYQEVREGDALYWYDKTRQAIVWKSRVHQIERFEFTSKDAVRRRFRSLFGETHLNDPYFDEKADYGYCFALKIDSLVSLTVPKPSDIRFPRSGWLRCSDRKARSWLKNLMDLEVLD